jgi:PadR family transcriptional regulator, regulatory protein PadR
MPSARCRWLIEPGAWDVRARVERFDEAALLLLLRDDEGHGYELADALAEFAPEDRRVDLGNLYRLLRALESEGLVASEWRAGRTGPPKRTYELTRLGERLLDDWVVALRRVEETVAGFLRRYEEGRQT